MLDLDSALLFYPPMWLPSHFYKIELKSTKDNTCTEGPIAKACSVSDITIHVLEPCASGLHQAAESVPETTSLGLSSLSNILQVQTWHTPGSPESKV